MVAYLTKKRWVVTLLLMFAVLCVTMLLCVNIGSEKISIWGAIDNSDPLSHAIFFSSRLPRLLLALFVGMALASAGGAYQAMLHNPLADPFILGISGGAALGSVLAVALKLAFGWVSALAFVGSLVAMVVIFFITRKNGRLHPHTLLLTGVIFNAFSFALILFINAIVTMEQAYQILFLLMGNLEALDYTTIAIVGAFVLVGFATLTLMSGRINILTLGDNEAHNLGVDVERVRAITFIASSLMVGAAVAACGLIGFVGLFIPHAVRMIFGADNRLLIPASGILGAAFLILADTLARTVLMHSGYSTLLPVGVITALIGGPVFAILLKRRESKA
ncbi:MAG: iron ABC transporter permease [Pseudomonadota bacterium]